MKNLSLQSWLVQSERRMHLRCPPGLSVTQNEYLSTLRDTAEELQLPLELETVDVIWEDANLKQTRIQAKLQAKERFGILTGLDYIGRVAFVEQKTYLDPIELPDPSPPDYKFALIIGGGGVLAAFMLFLLSALGGLLGSESLSIMASVSCLGGCLVPLLFFGGIGAAAVLAYLAQSSSKTTRDEVIQSWISGVLNLSRRAEISNELNNTAQALDEAVKLAVDRLFTQQGAEMEADERKRKTATEIQNEMTLRKEEFK